MINDKMVPMPAEIAAIRKQILQRRIAERDLGLSGKPENNYENQLSLNTPEYNPLMGYLSAAIPGTLAPLLMPSDNPYLKYLSIPIASLLGFGAYNMFNKDNPKFIPIGQERGMYR